MNMNMQQLISMLQKQSNPMYQNLAQLIQSHDTQGLETLARNLMQSQGKDFDKEFNAFKNRLGGLH